MTKRPPTPLLDSLAMHVVSVELQPNGMFRIREECDGNFYDEFTAEQLAELAGELIALVCAQSE